MDLLKDFKQKDMIEQISILDAIKENAKVEAVPELMEIYTHPVGDQAVDEMVYHTLFELLAGREQDIIAGLQHESEAVQLLCVRRIAEGASDAVLTPLLDLLRQKGDREIAAEIIRALRGFHNPELIDILFPFLQHGNYTVAAWAMRVLAGLHDIRVRDGLMELITASADAKGNSGGCDLRVALAVENLAGFDDDTTIDFLVGHIHHVNPAFRRVVITTLTAMGDAALPALERVLEQGDSDEKIMAANIIGLMGAKAGADILVAQLEAVQEPNLKFAIYEALGRIPSMRSVIGLTDGLNEEDELVLIAVVTALDQQCNPGVVKVLNDALDKKDGRSGQLLSAIITTRAVHLFAALYKAGRHAETLMDAVLQSGDREAADAFRTALEQTGDAQAKSDAARLHIEEKPASARRILAADDSKAMLFFYKSVAKELGMELVTVEDGKQAFETLQAGADVDLLITDMNMPNMDGIELTREVRKEEKWAQLPILMATTESEQTQSDLARESGVTDFITKPFTKEDFKAKLERML